jgi:hypothetical protein
MLGTVRLRGIRCPHTLTKLICAFPPTAISRFVTKGAGKKHSSQSGAEARYIEIAKSLGWTRLVVDAEPSSSTKSSVPDDDDLDLDDLDDEAEEPSGWDSGQRRGGGGMGLTVSSLAREDDPNQANEQSLHVFALSGNVEKLRESINDGADVNGKDEYVGPSCSACKFRIETSVLVAGIYAITSGMRSWSDNQRPITAEVRSENGHSRKCIPYVCLSKVAQSTLL